MIEGDVVESYQIQKLEYDNYDLYEVLIANKVEYCYYEKCGNRFASHVYLFLFDDCPMDSFLENSIYFFSQDFRKIGGIIGILRQEFNNLEFHFVIQDGKVKESVEKFISELRMEAEILEMQEYFNRSKFFDKELVGDRQSNYYDLKDDSLFMKELEERVRNRKEMDKTFADYNGFNERLIDSNVRNIVQFKKSGGGKNEL